MIESVAKRKHTDIPQKFSYQYKELLDQIFQTEPERRVTIDEILSFPIIKQAVTEWVNSTLFMVTFKESMENMIFMGEEDNALQKAHLTHNKIDTLYVEYVKKVATLTTKELPSGQKPITKEQHYQQYEKVRVIEVDNQGYTNWLVQGKFDKQLSCMKAMNITGLNEEDFQTAENEVKMFKDIVHPNIARIKKYFRAEGEFCSLSEFCDGGDLNVEIRKRYETKNYFKEETLLTWFTHIACGLKKMHDKGIAHR